MRKHHPKIERIRHHNLAHLEESATSLLDKADAKALTQRIRTTVDGLWDMLLEAHDRQAWKALGYKSWNAYVKEEIGISRQRSYQLLWKGRVTMAVGEATGKLSTDVDISEADARDIKPDLPAVTAEIKARVEAGEDPKKATAETIAAKRAEKAEKQAQHDREREEHLAKMPDAVKVAQAAKQAAIEARKAKPENALSDADRIEELEESVRVLEAENAALKAENALYADMKVQWAAGGFEEVIAGKDEVIRTLESRVYGESEKMASWKRSADWWKDQAIRHGWSANPIELFERES